ncbi:glycerol dehydratase reactivase beta/small subunit family protein [Listeria swaminathanii]|uniref:Glycerol dehydratase reactivase beta/small subunit family protein n=1 Tax=Listeria swaminathanii TaxID=2713501 RepID=A0ABU2IE71_9LIST|nr:glycerol dehydratase reactivase beta/small subunit family protein [Listeria swaminathanii]MDT0016421.1 glycerol dehydratase reactivase beta/small subunit family protein [Listeria swaminathanii]MDT0021857.1 glycerol dehydratase reactivase beta/small subunit family protein [Listeria swaminathanii]MDT0032821.1 glycerol dehydratase reactivase beta/small subunit family protein [Listeria swaminathanii]MDT0051329.1 glycerol dehydratase reactivase beta/small subunit family protein [Listeria swaminat
MIPVVSKPAIYFHADKDADSECIKQVLFGIEEEGIPCELEIISLKEEVQAAFRASASSPLLVGITLKNDHLVIHYRNLPPDKPLFSEYRFGAATLEKQRNMGMNAARLVKGVPFK